MAFFNEENILSARFINNEKTDIEVLFKGSDDSIVNNFVKVDTSQQDFIELLKIYTIEQIEQNTKKWIEDQNQAVIQFHKKLIESGQVTTQEKTDDIEVYNEEVIQTLFFFDDSKDSHRENLFKFKLDLFNLEEIQNASDEIKESIRQASTPLDLILLVKSVLGN